MKHAARPIEGVEWHRLRVHTRGRWHAARLAEARDSIAGALALSKRPYVAFSCGKDSVALALLVLEADRSVPLHFLSSAESRDLHDMDTVLDWFSARGSAIREWRVDEVGESWAEHNDRSVRREMRYAPLSHDRDCVFLGLRADEGPARAATLHSHRDPALPRWCYRYATGSRAGLLRCCPLAKWTTDDVLALIAEAGAPLLGWYHEFGGDGRTTARITTRVASYGTIAGLQRTNPEGARRILARFPELRSTL